jgi:glycosyltransferase involved in cell wall biosynthesis
LGCSEKYNILNLMKRVLLLIPNLDFGGAQRVFKSLSEGLAAQYEVTECVFNLDKGHAFPSTNSLISLNVPAGNSLFGKVCRFVQRCYRVNRIKNKLKIDITISHLEGADYVNYFSFSGEKKVFCIHGSKLYDQNITGILGWFRSKVLIPLVYPKADRLVAVSQGIKDELVRNFSCGKDRITVINNGFDIEAIQTMGAEPLENVYSSFFQTNRILITHGRLVNEKNHELLLKVFSDKSLQQKAKLVVLGDGPLRRDLVELSKSLQLLTYHVSEPMEFSERYDVYFLGYQHNPYSYLSRSTCFLFPSKYEGYPLSLCEAMACGLPVISSNCNYGPEEILGYTSGEQLSDIQFAKYGVLVPLFDVESWVRAITLLLDGDALLNNYKSQSELRAKSFSLSNFTVNWNTLVNELTQKEDVID